MSAMEDQYKLIEGATRSHVESFNFAVKEGLFCMLQNLPPLKMVLPNGDRLEVKINRCSIGKPSIKKGTFAKTFQVFPAECRGRKTTYNGNFLIEASWTLNGIPQEMVEQKIGELPIMVKSKLCNLEGMKTKELVAVGEEEHELGGYFIINGLEKVIRFLIAQRRNYPIAMQRKGWKKRGDLFTDYGVSVRCVRDDQSGANIVMHYLSDGSVKLMFTYKREMYVVPLMIILKALLDEPDFSIYKQLVRGKEKDPHYQECIKNMLRTTSMMGLFFQESVLTYLGEKFRVKLDLPSWYSSAEVARFLIEQSICVHLKSGAEKFDFLTFMVQKLFAVVKNECALESPDNPMNQEILTSGNLYLIVIKEKLYSWLRSVRFYLEKKIKATKSVTVNPAMMRDAFLRSTSVTRAVENFLSTGNFVPRFESSLQQSTGLVIIADKLNYWRYLSHFRAVHRGAYFAEMRTTTVRKLMPESWGFLCPVHTPDGSPCGLLNHMTVSCQVVNRQPRKDHLADLLSRYGVLPMHDPLAGPDDFYFVQLDGKLIGVIHATRAPRVVLALRALKSMEDPKVPFDLEICFVPRTKHASQYPGLFLFSTPARMMRPVINLVTEKTELIGTFEQVYLHIALKREEAKPEVTFHQEIDSTNILSILANQIPFSDHNQSPRNMYECQMGKQTMGTPGLALRYRSDNKMYQLHTPQSPLVRPEMYDTYKLDDYPIGTNAIVAVISYTGMDMEDAIVLNRASVNRGFKHASIYKTETVNLRLIAGDHGQQKSLIFGRERGDTEFDDFIDVDGLPHIGTRLKEGDPICSYLDMTTGRATYIKYKSSEEAYIDDVKILGNDTGTEINQQVIIKFRVPRNPIIGDKFASRHGQKGICSILLPPEDLPFTDSGMTPDILFNPCGFPSRMTIGMMIESMAGKSACVEGVRYDATPFTFSEKNPAHEYFGECLKKAGFDYFGTERMYSGSSGEELEADIFFGVIYYQRLRHMVADKFQVRTTGPVDPMTRQPIKGRKRGGGVRFGEMERDALIAHGASFLLHDRLFTCSDASQQYVCGRCHDLLSPVFMKQEYVLEVEDCVDSWTCHLCGSNRDVHLIDIPYIFRYLCAELAVMNIKVGLVLGDFT